MKTLSAGITTEITASSYISTDLVEFDLATPLYLAASQFDVYTSTDTSSGYQTYLAQGNFMSFSSVTETEELRINNVNINFTAATSTYVNIALADNYLHRKIRIYKVWFDKTTWAIIASPLLIYSGTITGASVSDNDTESGVSFITANQFYDFDRVTGRKTNNGSQRRYYPADSGMIYSTTEIADVLWGKV